jgi:pyruvate,water dikinase
MNQASKTTRFLRRIQNRMGFGEETAQSVSFNMFFETFQKTLALNNEALAVIAEMGDKLSGDYIFDSRYIQSACAKISELVHGLIVNLNIMAPRKYEKLHEVFQKIDREIRDELMERPRIPSSDETIGYPFIDRDMADVVGAKNATLAEIKNVLGLSTPEGFALTTRAFDDFFKYNDLWDDLKSVTNAWRRDEISTEEASGRIQDMIQKGTVPSSLKKAITAAVDDLDRATGIKNQPLAIRSSAWGEDGEASFAGQYLSLLNQRGTDVIKGYKAVLASMYSISAMAYRRYKGFYENEVVMAVGCQTMVNATASGVVYTFDPLNPEADYMLVTAVWGMGEHSAAGRMATDRYRVTRNRPYEFSTIEIVRKEKKLVADEHGGTRLVTVPDDRQTVPALTPELLGTIAQQAMVIEKHFKSPQDIEFAVDDENNIVILQARPLAVGFDRSAMARELPVITEKFPVIMDNQGIIVQKGVAIGKVYIVLKDEDLDEFPYGAILVTRYTSPRFSKIIRRAAGIITDVGTATGHMATIAREFRVPTVVNTQTSTSVLQNGQEITLDADENKIYDGIIKALFDYHLTEEPIEETAEYRLLRRVLKRISILNLLDPSSKQFTPSECRTFHDIIRFVHEKVVEELINRQFYNSNGPRSGAVSLKLSIPLDLVMVDIDGGLDKRDKKSSVSPEQIISVPMRAFTDGLIVPGAWNTDPMSVDFGSFMSSMTRTFSTGMSDPRAIGQNLAVVSKQYANISLRLGYHFNMIDAYINDDPGNNYAYFRFFGGVTDATRRSRRAQFLGEVLARNDFLVEQKGDLVVARVKKLTAGRMRQKLYLLGVLVAFSRQLDVQMSSDQHVSFYADLFKQLIAPTLNQYEKGEISE